MNLSLLNKLLEEYYEGSLSPADEKSLLELLSSEDLPAEYFEDKMFITTLYSEGGDLPDAPAGLDDRILAAIDESEKNKKLISNKRHFFAVLSAAASILIIISFWFIMADNDKLQDTYQDPQLAYNETVKILYSLSANLNKGMGQMSDLSMIAQAESKMQMISESRYEVADELEPLKYLDNSMRLLNIGQNSKPENVK